MNRFFLKIFILFVALSSAHASSEKVGTYADFSELRSDLVSLVEFRAQALTDYVEIQNKVENDLPFNGRELNHLHETVLMRRPLFERLLKYTHQNRKILRNDPDQLDPKDQLKYLSVLAVAVTLGDTYWSSIHLYHDDNRLRRIINEGNSILGKNSNIMKRLLRVFLRDVNVKAISRGVVAYENSNSLKRLRDEKSEEIRLYTTLIDTSALLSDSEDVLRDRLKYRHKPQDLLRKIGTSVVYAVSKVFGNGMGLIQFRKGHLYRDQAAEADLTETLQPLDILLERTPFRLTDIFIPGYWGHVAIWLGTEAEIKALGLWDHPAFIPLHEEISSGRSIMQALRPGTQIDHVRSFLDVDDSAVLRIRNMDIEEKKRSLIVAASQYRKIYDFAFDVETQNTLVCSELVFMSFLDIDWRLERSLGRWTINPDAVAERATGRQELDTVLLYTGGKKQFGDLNAKMDHILTHSRSNDKKLLRHFEKMSVSTTIQ